MSGYSRGGSGRVGSGRGGHTTDLPYRGGRPGGSGGSRGGYQGGSGGHSGGAPAGPSMMLEGTAEPKGNVQTFEDSCMAENKNVRAETGQLAYRPAYGTKGRVMVLRANYFEMNFQPGVSFFSYRAKITPEPKPKRFLLEVWEKILSIQKIKDIGAASDKATELVTLEEIKKMSPLKITVNDNGQPKDYTVDLECRGEIDHKEVLAGLRNKRLRTIIDNEAVVVRALNILMAAHPGTDRRVVTLGKGNNNKFYWVDQRQQSMDLTGGLECIRGYYASVRFSAGRVLLNLSVNHSAFYRPGPLSNLCEAFVQTYGRDRALFNRYVKTLQVECTHLNDQTGNGEVRRIKTIWGLADPDDGRGEPNPPKVPDLGSCANNVKFWLNDQNNPANSRYISVAEYFKQQYNMTLRHGDKPVMNVGTKQRPIYLPQDVLVIPRGRVFRGELGTTQRQNIIKFSCRRPPENYDSIINHGLDITGVRGQHTRRYGIDVSTQMVAVPGRVLSAPNLRYGGAKETPKFGSWNLIRKKFTKGTSVKSWAAVVLKKDRDPRFDVMKAFRAFGAKMAELGLNMQGLISEPLSVQLEKNPKRQLAQINDMLAKLKGRGVGLAVILLPNGADRIFDHLKWRADTVDGVVTHCCLMDKFGKDNNEQYFANNAMKVNLRLGGVNQTLDLPASSALIAAGRTMVVGLDVTHPSPTDPETFPSIASIVASTNASMGQWPGQVKIQERRKEPVLHLKEMLLARLHRWKNENRVLPQNILIFRDGVSEGQYNMVLTEELQRVKEACKAVYTGAQPNITILVGGKRHNTRFFPTKQTDLDRTQNCPNGTVVDRGITRPIYWEFFLQAQSPLQGSARSAHYVVIYDEIFTNPSLSREIGNNPSDAIQELTHNICYMMGRCTRSISYSTPAFLADRFADRARKYVRAYYYEHQVVRNNFRPPAPGDAVTTLARGLTESMVYI